MLLFVTLLHSHWLAENDRKTAYEYVTKYGIKSIDDLKKAYNNGDIELNDQILLGLKYHGVYKQNIPRKEIDDTYEFLKTSTHEFNKDMDIIICGSYRRGLPTSNDVDVIITHKNIKTKLDIATKPNYLIDFVKFLHNKKFLVDDMTYEDYESKYMGFSKFKKNPVRRIDIRYIPHDSYYTAILYFTGPGDYNAKMRNTAKLLGFKLNEYGLYKINGKRKIKLKINSEQDVFNHLELEYLEPKDRL